MAGIVAFGGYVPLYRLGPGTEGWKASGEKAVASFDEDSITMGVAAGVDCLKGRDRRSVDGVFFATTTPPYEEKLGATTIATACDLRRDIVTADAGHSLRASTTAFRSALDAVAAGTIGNALVVAADLRVPPPGSSFEPIFGDAAAALLVGEEDVALEVEAYHSIADEVLDVWRMNGESFVRTWEERFTAEQGYLKVVPEVVGGLLERTGLRQGDFAKIVLAGPTTRRIQEVAARMGFDAKAQLEDGLFARIGNSGTAAPLLFLASAVEQASPGQRILLVNYGNGADAWVLKVTEHIHKLQGKSHLPTLIDSKRQFRDYQTYQRWRGLAIQAGGPRRPNPLGPSAASLKREENLVYRFLGNRCLECGTIQYPAQRVCTSCYSKDRFESVRLSDKRATLFTYTFDYLASTPEPPNAIGIIDFEGGGRMLAAITDRDVDELAIGMAVEMSFRKLVTVEGIHNYYWKAIPAR